MNIWRKKIYFSAKENKNEANIWRRRYIFLQRRRKRRIIFGEENIFFAEEKKNREGRYLEREDIWRRKIYLLLRRRKTEKEKEGYILRREIYFLQKNGEGKGGKYLEEGNIFFAEKRSRKRRQIFGEGK